VIGSVIDNLNQVLDTVNSRDSEFTQLVITVRELVAGCPRTATPSATRSSRSASSPTLTADLLHDARPPLKDDIEQLGTWPAT